MFRPPVRDDDPRYSVTSHGRTRPAEHANVALTDETSVPRTYKEAKVRSFTQVEELAFNQTFTLDAKCFQRVLGAFTHPMLGTRPDISYTVATLGRHAGNPGFEHPHPLDRLSQYLCGAAEHKLVYRSGVTKGHALVGYTDVDWGSNHKYTSGAEAEHIAGTHAARDAIWLERFFASSHQPITLPISPCIDNQSESVIATVRNPEFHHRAKYHQFFRYKVDRRDDSLDHVPTTP